jgi:MarR family transcriptional regulator, organic hydroperoxide resistance regulator
VQKLKKEKAFRDSAQDDRLLAERFMELFRSMKRYIREEVAPNSEMRMSEERIRCLAAMRYLGKSRLKSLAAYDGLSTPAQCLMLNQLVQDGLAVRSEDPEDRRNVFYELTQTGLALLDSELARRTDLLCRRLSRLRGTEKVSFAKAVEKVLSGVQKIGTRQVHT